MINAVLIGSKLQSIAMLKTKLNQYCPNVSIFGSATSSQEAFQLIEHTQPNLVFLEACMTNGLCLEKLRTDSHSDFETIFVSSECDYAVEAVRHQAIGFVLFPINEEELITVVEKARDKIDNKNEQKRNKNMLDQLLNKLSSNELIGIPTIEGFEFIAVGDIIRCEGLQKCTRVVTKNRSDIISSYNIGEFKKLLCAFGFFAPHKSHLINLRLVRRYHREGTIIMQDNSSVPVARRRKHLFLQKLTHL